MPTGQTQYFKQNINSFLCLLLIGSFALGCGLILWHAAYGYNPVESMLLSTTELPDN